MSVVPIDWQAEALRFSAFVADPIDVPGNRLWERVTHRRPDSLQEHQTPQPLVIEEGPFGIGQALRSEVRSDRLDLRLVPAPVEDSFGVLLLGPYNEVITPFRKAMQQWLASANCPSFVRIAFGAVLLLEVEGLEDGHRRLGKFLSLNVEGASDLEYKINRPRPSSVIQGLEINRLCGWSLIKVVAGTIEISANDEPPAKISARTLKHMCRLELDVNTVRSNTQELNRVGSIFGELVDIGAEISECGDIS